jgi:small-conductance mechanosensitive channel
MEDFVNDYLFDPTIGKLVSAALGIIAVIVVVRILQRVLSKYIRDSGGLVNYVHISIPCI